MFCGGYYRREFGTYDNGNSQEVDSTLKIESCTKAFHFGLALGKVQLIPAY